LPQQGRREPRITDTQSPRAQYRGLVSHLRLGVATHSPPPSEMRRRTVPGVSTAVSAGSADASRQGLRELERRMASPALNGHGFRRQLMVYRTADLASCCRAGGDARLNGRDVLPVRGTRDLSACALPSTLRCALDVLVKEPPDAVSGTTAAAPRSTRTSSASGHDWTRRCNRQAERSGWIVASAADGTAGVIRHLPAGPETGEGRACHHRRPARDGKQATPGSVDRGAGLARARGEG
jgi:hypothetical protein